MGVIPWSRKARNLPMTENQSGFDAATVLPDINNFRVLRLPWRFEITP
jgi:hypothetical protein